MATNFVKASFQEIYDFCTKPGSATIVGVHTPISTRVHEYLHGFFEQYRKFRYAGCSMVVVPVSQLPVDPLQVSYEAGEPGVDPRDIVNPILHRGMHGESLGNTLESIFNLDLDKSIFDGLDVVDYDPVEYPETAGQLDSMYYSALSSPAWRKSHVQQGFRKAGLTPMYYSLGTNRQMMPFYAQDFNHELGVQTPESDAESILSTWTDGNGTSDEAWEGSPPTGMGIDLLGQVGAPAFYGSNGTTVTATGTQYFSGRMMRLGWLDTLQSGPNLGINPTDKVSYWTALPKLYMYMMMLPPCYKQRLHFRVILTHYYQFRGFRAMRSPGAFESFTMQSYDGIDGVMVPINGKDQPFTGVNPDASALSLRSPSDTLTLIGVDGELVTDGVS